MSTKLDRERQIFEKLLPKLLASHPQQFALIYGDEFAGVFDSYAKAAKEGYSRFGNVPFFIKQVLEEEPVFFVG